jgi:hypothetical protein
MHARDDADPREPTPSPTTLNPLERSLVAKRSARSATKIGTEAFATAATPESTWVSPQEIKRNGSAIPTMPTNAPGASAGRTARRPRRAAKAETRTTAASNRRNSTSAAGEKSRTPTLMNMYDEPQMAESRSKPGR